MLIKQLNFLKFKLIKKHFSIKIKSTIKDLKSDSKSKVFETYDNLDKDNRKDFYEEFRDSIMSIDSPKKLKFWLAFHTIPSLLFITQLPNIVWIYQLFWSGTVSCLAMISYEFYSDKKEKNILDLHIIGGFLLCILAIGLAIYYKTTNDKKVLPAYILNFIFLYLLIYRKNNQFFFPYWLKRSLAGYMTIFSFLIILNYFNDKLESLSTLDNIDEKINLVQYRYIKELSIIINEANRTNPNIDILKKYLKEKENN